MSEEQLTQAVYTGMNVVKSCKGQGYQLLATGEMGIGNTTTSTALACILLDLKPQEVTGRGAGLDNAGLKRKTEVIAEAQRLYTKYKKSTLSVTANRRAGHCRSCRCLSGRCGFTGYL